KLDQSEKLMGKAESTKNYFTWLNQYLYLAGFFILGGVILDVIFKTYFFYDVVNTVNISAISASVFSIVKGYDITTSIFLINMVLFNSVMSLKTLSAVLMLFKWKGALSYYIYFGLWVCILSVVNILA
ncbi:MAG: hypothetical protein N2376_12140, partial [Clostridia bacterium]|nr:hypothetical protein [Clostridia bacterium]